MTTGLLIAFIGLLLNIGGATDQLTQAIPLLMNGAGGLGRIEDILSHEPELADRPDAKPLATMKNALSMQDVEFGYTPDNPILRGVTLVSEERRIGKEWDRTDRSRWSTAH